MSEREIFSLENIEVVYLVRQFLGDEKKARDWLNSSNPNLGHVTPIRMMMTGRSKRLLEWVRSALAQNLRDV